MKERYERVGLSAGVVFVLEGGQVEGLHELLNSVADHEVNG